MKLGRETEREGEKEREEREGETVQDYDGANSSGQETLPKLGAAASPPLPSSSPRLPCQMKRQKSNWKMKYANDVASVVVLTAGLSLLLSLFTSLPPSPFISFLSLFHSPFPLSSPLSLALQLLLRQLAAH